jgi:IMP dehydrogenase
MEIPLGLTFDDVLLRPAESDILPTSADTRTRLTREIGLNIPVISSAMDTVTEADMAIVMAQLGGIGVLHRNLSVEEQVAAVRAVKRFESGMVVNPITITPEATLGEAQAMMQVNRISGIPVVEASGKLVGILTNRDVRFADNPAQPVRELMTHENLATVKLGVGQEEARRLLHQRRIEKLLVVDDAYRCIGLITVKDIEKAVTYPEATKDAAGRLRVAAATTVGDKGFARTEALLAAECDLIIIDTAHGHNKDVARAVERVKKLSNSAQVIAGNVATAEATRALIEAGADAVKIGIGPGSICTTRIVAGVGVPQLTAVMESAGDRGRRPAHIGRRRQGAGGRRLDDHGRLNARRYRGSAGRDLHLPGPRLQIVPRNGLGGGDGPRLGRPLFPGRHQGRDEAGARGHRRPGAVQGPCQGRDPPTRRRHQGGDGLHRIADDRRPED